MQTQRDFLLFLSLASFIFAATPSNADEYTLVQFVRFGQPNAQAANAEASTKCQNAGFPTVVAVVQSGFFADGIGPMQITYVAMCKK